MAVSRFFIIMAVAGSVSACATDDPSKGGFFGGLVGLSSGSYSEDLEGRKARLEALKQRQAEAEKLNKELKAQLETREEAAQRLTSEVQGMDGEIAQARSRLSKLKSKNKDVAIARNATLVRLDGLKKEIAYIKTKIAASDGDLTALSQQLNTRKEVFARLSEDVDKMVRTTDTP